VNRRALAALGAGLLAAGCLAPQPAPRVVFYALRPERTGPAPESPGAEALWVGRVRVAPLVEGKGFVYRTGESTFEADFYHRFAAPPGALVREALIDWLGRSGLFSEVRSQGSPGQARWSLEARVTALHADLRDPTAPSAVLEAELALIDAHAPAPEARLRERYHAEVTTSADPAALAQAWARGLAQVLAEAEDDLRAALASAMRERASEPGGRQRTTPSALAPGGGAGFMLAGR
jgi:uncharacterized lipoprotein YmbA